MVGKKFDPTRASMQEAIDHFSTIAPYMAKARTQSELNEMIDGYQSMIGGRRDKGLRQEMIAYLAANGISEDQTKLSSEEVRSSMSITSGTLRMGWYERLRFKLLDLFRRH